MNLSRAFVWTAAASAATVAALHFALSPVRPFEASAAEPRAGERAPARAAAPVSTPPSAKSAPEVRPLVATDPRPAARTPAARADDDTTLYTFDLAVLDADDMPLPGEFEFRLLRMEGDDPVFGWVHTADDTVSDLVRVPRQLLADIDAAPEAWKIARDNVGEGLVVDFQREMLV